MINPCLVNEEEDEMAKGYRGMTFLQVLRWLSLILAILFFIWLAKNLGWLKI